MRFTYRNDLSELEKLAKDLETFGEKHGINPAVMHAFNLCLDEILTNIVSYGFDDGQEDEVELEIEEKDEVVTATIIDHGKSFNPLTEAQEPDLEASVEDRAIGGLGIFFMKQMMDSVDYQRINDCNCLTMSKSAPSLAEGHE